jgi:branched-chain amino acid transport system ATP-binding protein
MMQNHGFLEIKDLAISFGGLRALKEVGFQIRKGEILSLIGPNGAGKTTLLNLLTGFLRPQQGSIRFKGETITGLSPFSIAYKGILRTFQNVSLFPKLTVVQNVLTGFHCRTQRGFLGSILSAPSFKKEEREIVDSAREILKKLDLGKQADGLAKNLPYGDQRKLGIAISLAGGPELLLLDEPAAGMNPDESISLMNIIKGLKQSGITILLVEHDMKVVMGISERIIVLNHGEKIAEGTPQEISKNEDVIRVYLGHSSFRGPQ